MCECVCVCCVCVCVCVVCVVCVVCRGHVCPNDSSDQGLGSFYHNAYSVLHRCRKKTENETDKYRKKK